MSAEYDLTKAIRSIVADEVRRQLDAAGVAVLATAPTAGQTVTEFYYCSEVATKLRRTDASVRWLWNQGTLKSRVVGGRRVSTQADLDEFLTGDAS